MTKSTTWIVIMAVLLISITAVFFNSQNKKITELIQIQRQLADKNQLLKHGFTSLNQQLKNIKSSRSEIDSASDSLGEINTAQMIIKSLNSLQLNLSNLDTRIEQLEGKLGRLANQQNLEHNRINEATSLNQTPETQSSLEQRLANAESKQNALTQYFQDLEQTILQTIDTTYTQAVQYSYEDVISSREDWANDTSIKSSECGSGFCKVVLNYKDNMDPVSQIEFDAMAYSQVPELPNSRSQYRKNADGTTDIIIYAARNDTEFPAFEN